jgi:uncharacterized membrane protein YiaA
MFIPIGGIFFFGNDGTGSGAVFGLVISVINLIMGATALFVGYNNGILPLVVIGYFITTMGALMLLTNLIGIKKRDRTPDSPPADNM